MSNFELETKQINLQKQNYAHHVYLHSVKIYIHNYIFTTTTTTTKESLVIDFFYSSLIYTL